MTGEKLMSNLLRFTIILMNNPIPVCYNADLSENVQFEHHKHVSQIFHVGNRGPVHCLYSDESHIID